jgi:hypothetical protein
MEDTTKAAILTSSILLNISMYTWKETCSINNLTYNILILGWCILLRSYFNENHKSITFVRNLSCLYCTQITLHVSAILKCMMYIKMLKLLLKHNGSVNLLSNLTIIQVLYTKTIYI